MCKQTVYYILAAMLLIILLLCFIYREELRITKNNCFKQEGLCVINMTEYNETDPCGERGTWVSKGSDNYCSQLTQGRKPYCCVLSVAI